jgi:hypothetical protein
LKSAWIDRVGKEWMSYADESHGWHQEYFSIDLWKHVGAFLDMLPENGTISQVYVF